MRRYPLLSFFLLTFAITWGLGAVYFLFGKQLEPYIGPVDHSNPLFYLAVYAPSISAVAVVWRTQGGGGLRLFLARLLQWRIGWRWYAFLVLAFVLAHLAARGVAVLRGEAVPGIPYAWYMAVPLALYWLFVDAGPIGEELGWRGFALPLLQRRFHPLAAAVLLGTVWAVWHIPAFFISGLAQSKLSFPFFVLQAVGLSYLMMVTYNATAGSVPLAIVIHWLSNAGGTMNLHEFNETGMIAMFLFYCAAAIVVTRVAPGKGPFKDPVPGWKDPREQ